MTDCTKEEGAVSCYLLLYDIPSNSKFPNPSGQLRRVGFRANLSCWVIPAQALPHTLIHELRTKANANVDLVKFDVTEGPRLVRMAIAAMQKEVAEFTARAKKNMAEAAERHLDDAAETPGERDAAQARYEMRAEAILDRLKELHEDVSNAIGGFGVAAGRLDLGAAWNAFTALQAGYAARAKAYTDATVALRAAASETANALAGASAADAVPPEVMADALRDAGDEAGADALQAAFAEPETFSLVGEGDE